MSFESSHRVELGELYQDVILDHSKYPRFKRRPVDGCRFCEEGKNPLCGDTITLYAKLVSDDEDRLSLNYDGSGCSISQASASMMCDLVQDAPVSKVRHLIYRAESLITGKEKVNTEDLNEDLEALSGVSKFPVRVKCAVLPWKTLEILINNHFDSNNKLMNENEGCKPFDSCLIQPKKIKIITE